MFDIENIKKEFPFFLNHPEITYLDSATTTQKPYTVLKTLADFYSKYNAGAYRSNYPLANKLSKEIEQIREKVKKFINANEKDEIIFNFGSTDGFNKVVFSLGLYYLKNNDEVIYCPYDHQSFIFPWFIIQKLLKKTGVNIRLIPVKINKLGCVDRNDLFSKITKKTKIINITHVHSVFGADNDINKIKEWIGKKDIIINVDATQSIGHLPVDV
ncbi:MAG: aminotransferase class V-fold PLP-dependent enzyme, partial [Bacteroidales bacterium]